MLDAAIQIENDEKEPLLDLENNAENLAALEISEYLLATLDQIIEKMRHASDHAADKTFRDIFAPAVGCALIAGIAVTSLMMGAMIEQDNASVKLGLKIGVLVIDSALAGSCLMIPKWFAARKRQAVLTAEYSYPEYPVSAIEKVKFEKIQEQNNKSFNQFYHNARTFFHDKKNKISKDDTIADVQEKLRSFSIG